MPRFETESRTINNIKWNRKRKNEAVFVIFMSKALQFKSFPPVSFKVNSILMENGRKTQQNRMTMALPVNATRRDRDGGLDSHIVLLI